MAALGEPGSFHFTRDRRLLRFVQRKKVLQGSGLEGARQEAGGADKRPGRVVAHTGEVVGGRET